MANLFSIVICAIAALIGGLVVWSQVTNPLHSELIGNIGSDLAPNYRGREGENFFKNKQGLWIHYRAFGPAPKAKIVEDPVDIMAAIDPEKKKQEEEAGHKKVNGLVFISHSFTDHSLYYEELGRSLEKAGYLVYAIDHQGFGFSEGDRGHVDNFTTYASDLAQFIKAKKAENAGRTSKTFCVGQSMGASILIEAIHQNPSLCSGVVLSSLPVYSHEQVGFIEPFSSLFDRVSTYLPKLPIARSHDISLFTSDTQIQDRIANDDRAHPSFYRARFSNTFVQVLKKQLSYPKNINYPLLVLTGGEDSIGPVEETKQFYDQIVSKDKSLKKYEKGKHDLFLDSVRKDVIKDTLEWIQSH